MAVSAVASVTAPGVFETAIPFRLSGVHVDMVVPDAEIRQQFCANISSFLEHFSCVEIAQCGQNQIIFAQAGHHFFTRHRSGLGPDLNVEALLCAIDDSLW